MLKLKLQYFGHLMQRVAKSARLRWCRNGREELPCVRGQGQLPGGATPGALDAQAQEGLDLIDRVPDELWNEVHDIVQETDIKTIRMEKKWKKAKWLSGEALQIALKRREAKDSGL